MPTTWAMLGLKILLERALVHRDRVNAANILLIGPRASGKTTVGALLARRLHRSFIDLDVQALTAFSGCDSISQAWRTHGESAWRRAEAAALDRVLGAQAQVVALGGGTPIIPASRRLLAEQAAGRAAFIVYLQCSAALLGERLRNAAGDRPPLKGFDAVAEVAQVLREREPTYLALANLVVDASRNADDVASTIVAAFSAWESPSSRAGPTGDH